MSSLARWLAPAALAATLAAGAAFPAPAQAAGPTIRVIVDLGDVIFRNGQPYYRYGHYGYGDRLVVERDYRGRPVYYRHVPRDYDVRYGPPYGNAYGYHRTRDGRYSRQVCDSRGRCRVEYYDPRYDHRDDRRHDDRYGDRYDRRYGDRYGDRDDRRHRGHDRDDHRRHRD